MNVVDSSSQPTAAQAAAAKAAGVQAWLGYLASGPNKDILEPWADATFAIVQAAGLRTGAYCSGLDDPAWVKAKAAALGIPVILDVETSIRGDGPWVDPWLASSGAGLYGGSAVQAAHRTHGHPFYVAAYYPSPAVAQTALWPSGMALPSPTRPTGWQYGGDWTMPYGNVDVSNFDPALWEDPPVALAFIISAGSGAPTYLVTQDGAGVTLVQLDDAASVSSFTGQPLNVPQLPGVTAATVANFVAAAARPAVATAAEVAQVDADVRAIPPSGGLAASQEAQLTDIQAHVDADLH